MLKRRALSILLTLMLVIGLFPMVSFGAEAPWATEVAAELNRIYDVGVFSADDGAMTEKDAAEILTAIGASTEEALDTESVAGSALTRSKACEILADVYAVPVPARASAINYFANQKIINGKANGDLAPNDGVSFAEFALLAYRVMNFSGAGTWTKITELKPGTKEYFSWMYLATRKCLEFNADKIGDSATETVWNSWVNRLNSLPPDSPVTDFNAAWPYGEAEAPTKLEAAIKIVDLYIAAGGSQYIFSDVTPESPCAFAYGGIMYLFDQEILAGVGTGEFWPDRITPRFEFAALLARYDGVTSREDFGADPVNMAKIYVTEEKDYMTLPGDVSGTDWWESPVTRVEAIVGIMKAVEGQNLVDVSQINLSILDRFADADDIPVDAKPYVAYAVSLGLVNGSLGSGVDEGKLFIDPDGTVMRCVAGVLLYRTIMGPDETKLKDYTDSVAYALEAVQPAPEPAPASFMSLFGMNTYGAGDGNAELILSEDWRITAEMSEVDLNVPEGVTLTVNGNGYFIYELGGKLKNSGPGAVEFADGTMVYPVDNDGDLSSVGKITQWTAVESEKLLFGRQVSSALEKAGTEATIGYVAVYDNAGKLLLLDDWAVADGFVLPGDLPDGMTQVKTFVLNSGSGPVIPALMKEAADW